MDGVSDDVGDVLVDQGVDGLPALALNFHQAGAAQHPEVLRDQRLAHAQQVHQLVHEVGLAG